MSFDTILFCLPQKAAFLFLPVMREKYKSLQIAYIRQAKKYNAKTRLNYSES